MYREELPKNTGLPLNRTECVIENCVDYGGSSLAYE